MAKSENRRLFAALKTVIAIAAIAFVISLNPIDLYSEFPGSIRLDSGQTCNSGFTDCDNNSDFSEVVLPAYVPATLREGNHRAFFRFDLDPLKDTLEANSQVGVFLPKFSNAIILRVNGIPLSAFDQLPKPRFNNVVQYKDRAYYTTFTTNILNSSDNILELELTAYGYQSLSLFPVYVGDSLELRIRYHIRQFIRVVIPQISFVFVLLVSLLILSLWLARRSDREYLWMALASFCMLVPCLNYFTPLAPLPDSLWTRTSALGVLASIYCCLHYVHHQFQMENRSWQKWVHFYLAISTIGLFAIPNAYLGYFLVLYFFCAGLIALMLPVTGFLANKNPQDLGEIHGWLFSTVLALCVLDFLYAINGPRFTEFQPAYLAPILLILGATALIFRRLARSIDGLERLNNEMAETIRIKSSEIAEYEKQKAIRKERQRITLDLHDGVGGQISNVLAYMDTSGKKDEFVVSNLEYAMRDMAVIIDSLEGGEDLGHLLGSLRDRIEPLLVKAGIALVWDVEESPQPGPLGPSAPLNMIRIIQEAVINSIKHAAAETITIRTTENEIHIMDDGIGFNVNAKPSRHGTNSGIGVEGMRTRCKALGVNCKIRSGKAGTAISLSW